MNWIRSSFCSDNACVEMAFDVPDWVLVRDSKDPDGPVLQFTPEEWEAFRAGMLAGEFDDPA